MSTQVRSGYKLTEVGVIPEDWAISSLKKLTVDMLQGINTAIDKPEYVQDGIPLLKANNIIDQIVNFNTSDHISLSTYSRYSDRYKLKIYDFLFSNIGARLGTGSLLKESVSCSFAWNIMRIVPDQKQIDPEFLSQSINSPKISGEIKARQSGSGMGFVPKGVMQNILIAYPLEIGEQKLISTALSDIDALISDLDQLIAKKRDIKQASMQQFLTGQQRLPGLSGEWSTKQLGEIASLLKGSSLSKSELVQNGANRCILYGELFTTYGRIIQEVHSRTSSNDGTPSKVGDVLLPGSTTTTGIDLARASALCEDNVLLGGDINIIRPKNSDLVDSKFLAYYLTNVAAKDIAERAQGITIIHLYGRDLRLLSIKLPSIYEQAAIAIILSDMDAELATLKTRRDKIRQLKQGMMQELLTGRIRFYQNSHEAE